MNRVWIMADPHFGHKGIINFTDDSGNLLRPFQTIAEHDAFIISETNKLVGDKDRLYILGDIAMKRKDISTVSCLNGNKVLLRGNHDIFKITDYLPYFEDIRAYKVFPAWGLVLSHIPIHKDSLSGRIKFNCHGHTHARSIDDPCYFNICPEKVGYEPILFEDLIQRMNLTETN